MINNVVLVGRLTRDPELRTTGNGTPTCQFTVACDRRNKQPGQPEADFISCVAWTRTAENMCRYLHKGSLIGVEGRIQTRSYDNKEGRRVYVTEVVANSVQFLESRNASQNAGASYGQPQDQGYGGYGQNSYGGSSYKNNYNSSYSQNSYSNANYGSATPEPGQNPYAQPAGNELAGSGYDESETLDIASDDLPF